MIILFDKIRALWYNTLTGELFYRKIDRKGGDLYGKSDQ